jgi:ssDNA-binding Zn-finger/Zn-ribbon topoisomerase 1
LVILALALLLGLLFPIIQGRGRREPEGRAAGKKTRNCPLCGSDLAAGERVKTHRFRGAPGGEDRVHLLGCPHCRAGREPAARRCPVCRQALPAADYLTAVMWREADRTRVHVLGCSRCSAGLPPEAPGSSQRTKA